MYQGLFYGRVNRRATDDANQTILSIPTLMLEKIGLTCGDTFGVEVRESELIITKQTQRQRKLKKGINRGRTVMRDPLKPHTTVNIELGFQSILDRLDRALEILHNRR
jgi:hypothetical protein